MPGTLRTIRSSVTAFFVTGNLLAMSVSTAADVGWPEKEDLTLGFIKLTDMAPLAIAYEKRFFEDEGLYVTLEPQANWRVLLDGVIDGRLDGAHMLAGQPLAATIGYGTEAHIVTPLSLDLNGNAITVSNMLCSSLYYFWISNNNPSIH
jgi:nitrate/nitrite transport system substrate-binding protein